jgi:type I restriction enzyme S subunit
MKQGDALSLPKGWEIKKLGEICEISTGNANTEDAVENGEFAFFDRSKIIKRSSSYLFDCDAIIIAGEGQTFLPKFHSGKFNLHQRAYAIFNFSKNVDIHYANKYLIHFHKYFEQVAVGATVKSLRLRHFQELPIPIPPLPEQQRIVSILDKAFAAIERSRNAAEQNLKNAKELFESFLQGVFENKGEGWETKTLKELTTKIGSGATPLGGQENYKAVGISLVRSMNVHDWEFRERNLAFIDEKQAKELYGVSLQENDVLLNITGASVARCCVFPKEYLPARVNQHVSIIRPKKELLDATFLNLLLTSKPYKDQLLFTGEQGATRQAITKAQIESFRISIPTLNEQQTIVHQLDALRAETKRLEAIYQQKLLNLEELKKSILQKAFAGELKFEKAVAV